jgi:hypothetical protein
MFKLICLLILLYYNNCKFELENLYDGSDHVIFSQSHVADWPEPYRLTAPIRFYDAAWPWLRSISIRVYWSAVQYVGYEWTYK